MEDGNEDGNEDELRGDDYQATVFFVQLFWVSFVRERQCSLWGEDWGTQFWTWFKSRHHDGHVQTEGWLTKKPTLFRLFLVCLSYSFRKKKTPKKSWMEKEIDPISSSASVRSNPQSIQQGCQMITWTLQGGAKWMGRGAIFCNPLGFTHHPLEDRWILKNLRSNGPPGRSFMRKVCPA